MALFSGLHTKVAVYGLLRIYMTVFEGDARYAWAILVIMVLGMVIGGFAGLSENTLRGVLASPLVHGIPYMLIPLALLSARPTPVLSAWLFYVPPPTATPASLITAGR